MRYNASLQGKEVTLSSQPTKENIVITWKVLMLTRLEGKLSP